MTHTVPTSTDDIIYSRDVIAQIELLIDEQESLQEEVEQTKTHEAQGALDDWNEEWVVELKGLLDLAEQGKDNLSDWEYGAMLIHDDYFETYTQDLAGDVGLLEDCTSWPIRCIDWVQAASELQLDYTLIDFDGETYWGLSG